MLILSRKPQEAICIGENIVVRVLEVHGNRVKYGIEAPRDIPIHRSELLEQSENLPAARQIVTGNSEPDDAGEREIWNESRNDRDQKSFNCGHCQVCGTPLCTRGGCAGSGMCGPCCTGEAETAGEY